VIQEGVFLLKHLHLKVFLARAISGLSLRGKQLKSSSKSFFVVKIKPKSFFV